MKILIVGAGATGGAYGTWLQEAGRNVTYLVRPARAQILKAAGLRMKSPGADRTHPVQTLTVESDPEPFGLIMIAVKATGFEKALQDIDSFVGPDTRIMPILNGMAHVRATEARYPGQTVGGVARIVSTLDGDAVHQMTGLAELIIGSLDDQPWPAEMTAALDVPGMVVTVTPEMYSALWAKWTFIAALGIVTLLFRGPIGKILTAGGEDQIHAAIAEVENIAAAAGYPVSAMMHQRSVDFLTEPGSALTSSLYRDFISGYPHEAEHILGDLAAQAQQYGLATPLLDLVLIQVRTSR